MKFWVTLIVSFGGILTALADNKTLMWEEDLINPAQLKTAVESLTKTVTKDSLQPNRALLSFANGVQAFQNKNDAEAIKYFLESIELKTDLRDYAEYMIGLSFRRQNDLPNAMIYFQKVIYEKPASIRNYDAQFAMGEIALEQKNYKLANKHFAYLERKLRRTQQYPFLLWNLALSELGSKRNWKSCEWVRKLYSKYPGHQLTKSWNLDLRTAEIEGQKPNCFATLKDQKNRIRQLQYAGHSEKAKVEIQELYKRTDDLTKFYVDMIYGGYLVTEGDVEEALKILLPHYEEHKSDRNYLMLVAKAAHRMGQTQSAAGFYLQAYKLQPRSKLGKEAYFQMALVSYQSQDYDGAIQKFEEYLKLYRNDRTYGDAVIYLIGWAKYLKHDFNGAYRDFSRLNVRRISRRQFYTANQVQYWKAVCLLKLGQLEKAKVEFENLTADPLSNYYSIAARARLIGLENIKVNHRGPASDKKLNQLVLPPPNTSEITAAPAQPENPITQAEVDESQSQEEELSGDVVGEERGDAADVSETDEELAAEDDGHLPKDLLSQIKDPRLNLNFIRAKQLRMLGYNNLANKELFAIESRTRNKGFLRSLALEYEESGAYYRSSYIGETHFTEERKRGGFRGAQKMWEKTYPLAFQEFILKFSKDFNVQKEVIWSVMRTESHYKVRATSPVGALGLMQVMPYTGQKISQALGMKAFNPEDLLEPDKNIQIATRYLKRLSEMFENKLPLVAAAYNAGPHRVGSWLQSFGTLEMDEFIDHIPYKQTRNYAKEIVRNYYVYKNIYNPEALKKENFKWLSEPINVKYVGSIAKESWEGI